VLNEQVYLALVCYLPFKLAVDGARLCNHKLPSGCQTVDS